MPPLITIPPLQDAPEATCRQSWTERRTRRPRTDMWFVLRICIVFHGQRRVGRTDGRVLFHNQMGTSGIDTVLGKKMKSSKKLYIRILNCSTNNSVRSNGGTKEANETLKRWGPCSMQIDQQQHNGPLLLHLLRLLLDDNDNDWTEE